jgi:SAM-dependent methyltransferase
MEAKYWLDLKTICEGEVVVDRIEYLGGYFSDGQFDFILLGKPINAYPAPFKLLQEILKLLKKDGHLLIQLRNTYDISTLVTTMGGGVSDSQSDNIAVYQMRLDELVAQLNNLEFAPKKIAPEFFPLNEGQQKALRDLITTTGFGNDPQEAFTRAAVRDYVIDVVRK